MGHDIAAPGIENGLLAFGIESQSDLAGILDHVPQQGELDVYGLRTSHVGDLSDYHILRKSGEPYLFFTCGRWEHYHEESDTPDKLNYAKMLRIVRYLEFLVLEIDKRSLDRSVPEDTTAFEVSSLQRMLGPENAAMVAGINSQSELAAAIERFRREFNL